MAAGFSNLIQSMIQQDIFSLVLPFLLSYIIFFLALQRVPIFDDNDTDNKFAALIAMIFAFFVAYFLTLNPQYQTFFPAYIGRITIGLIGILGLAAVVAFITSDGDKYLKSPLMVIVILIVVLSAWTMSGGAFAFLPEAALPVIGLSIAEIGHMLFDNGIIYLIVIGVALYWVSNEGDDSDDRDMADFISKLIGAD